MKQVHTTPSWRSKIHFNSIHSPMFWSSLWSLSFWLSHEDSACIPFLYYVGHMPFPSHAAWLIILNILGEELKLWSFSLCSFLRPPATSCFFYLNILSILFSNTFSMSSSLNVKGHVSHPYKTTGKIIVLYTLIFTFLDSRRGHSVS
jgi:hypothetical protein